MIIPLWFVYLFFITLFEKYTFRGNRGLEFLARRAQESGDYNKILHLRCLNLAVKFTGAGLFGFAAVYGLIVYLAENGKQGIDMDEARTNGVTVLLVVFCVFFLAATAVRLWILHLMRSKAQIGKAGRSVPREFKISYTVNPKHIKTTTTWLLIIVLLIGCGVMIHPPGLFTGWTVYLVFFLILLAVQINGVLKEKQNTVTLFIIDRRGITDRRTSKSLGFIPWQDIEVARAENRHLTLSLLRQKNGESESNELAFINLENTPYSDEVIQEKIEQYRRLAGQPLPKAAQPG